MKAIFLVEIDGDLLNVVRLSKGFRVLDNVEPLSAGDVCPAEARVVILQDDERRRAQGEAC